MCAWREAPDGIPSRNLRRNVIRAHTQGVAFIEEFLAENPGKRVFIHCKGGRYVYCVQVSLQQRCLPSGTSFSPIHTNRGRAAVMTACYYIYQRKGAAHPHEVVQELKRQRHVVSTAVAKYEVVREFHAHVVSSTGGSNGKAKAT